MHVAFTTTIRKSQFEEHTSGPIREGALGLRHFFASLHRNSHN